MELQQHILFAIFIFAVGACIGSFLNVVIWRLPNRGREVLFQNKRAPMTLSWPPSHCPVCDAPIRWYQNIPVFSWIFLKAKCANCKTDIPVRYPLVELGTAVLFVALYLAYFVAKWQNDSFTDLRDWHQAAALAVHLILIAALLAASAIDADLFIIPLSIPWFLAALGILAAIFINHRTFSTINPTYWLAKPILGGALGLIIANLLLYTKILPRSFSEEFMNRIRLEAEQAAAKSAKGTKREEQREEQRKASLANSQNEKSKKTEEPESMPPPPKLTRFAPSAIASILLVLIAAAVWLITSPKIAALSDVIAGILIFLIGVLPRDAGQTDVTEEVLEEISVPHVRGEALKEIPFLLVPAACAAIAFFVPFNLPNDPWLARLLGSLLGLLAGGGIVWLIRILGTLGFNKEAMGMGDAHLMAGVGAVIGAPLVIFAFFAAAFVAILWAIVLKITGKPNILPYGPWLSVASILALLIGNPFIAWYLHFALHP